MRTEPSPLTTERSDGGGMVPDPCVTEIRTGPSPMATEQSDGGMMPEAKSPPPTGTNRLGKLGGT